MPPVANPKALTLIAVASVFFFFNFGLQFLWQGATLGKADAGKIIVCVVYVVGSLMLPFSIMLLCKVICDNCFNRKARRWDEQDEDMCIIYGMTTFMGLTFSSLGVFLLKGSWWWHFLSILLGGMGCTLTDRDMRKRWLPKVAAPKDIPDTWEVPDSGPADASLRHRYR
eukprot:TRINITY_DN18250_c0_g1_i1.p2 TRINITY_DN18250_c0_g1~~TRINITY_DN18250_c0_g1_i1.p2  ORF type:complete len:169 (+),score=63.37 TRINITY_DN18250_c0_g1_i1:107-613(+)